MTTIFVYGFIVGFCFGFAVMEILNVIFGKEEEPKEEPKEEPELKIKLESENLIHLKASSMVAKEMVMNYPEAAAECIIGKISSQLKMIIKDHVHIIKIPEINAVRGELDIWVRSSASGDLNEQFKEVLDGKDLR